MRDPREPHLTLVKRILRYVKRTLSEGLHLSSGSVDSLTAYSVLAGQVVLIHVALLLVSAFSWMTTLFLGRPNDRP